MFLFTDRKDAVPAAAPAGAMTPALRAAAERTGTSFSYLLETARRESGLKPDAKATTSSARGLFQFIEQTWLSLVRTDGAAQGLGAEAERISVDARGRLAVDDPAERARILQLRSDPEVAARLAGVLAQKNREGLTHGIGREPTPGELYIAHFLGVSGASALIRMKERAPNVAASEHFPQAAAANRSIFYSRAGEARSAAAVYARLVQGFEASPAGATAVAEAQPAMAPFHGLFRNQSPVSEAVAQAWLPLARTGAAKTAARPGAIGTPLDLLSFSRVRSRVS